MNASSALFPMYQRRVRFCYSIKLLKPLKHFGTTSFTLIDDISPCLGTTVRCVGGGGKWILPKIKSLGYKNFVKKNLVLLSNVSTSKSKLTLSCLTIVRLVPKVVAMELIISVCLRYKVYIFK